MCKCRAALSAVCGGAPKSRGGPVAVSASATGASGVQGVTLEPSGLLFANMVGSQHRGTPI